MPFKHKLSKRLALMRDASLALAVAAIAACESQRVTDPALDAARFKPASVTVTPGSAGLVVGQMLQLTATVRNAQGNVIAGSTVAWSTRDSTVAGVFAGGLAVARSLGSATIIATSKGVSGYSDITVSLDPVASVTVTPSSASVQEIGRAHV